MGPLQDQEYEIANIKLVTKLIQYLERVKKSK